MTKIFYKFTEEVLNSWDNCTFTEENVKRVMEEQGYTKEKHALKWLQKLCKKLLRKNIGKPNPTGKPKTKSPSPPEDEELRLKDAEDKYNKYRREILADQYSPDDIIDVKFYHNKAEGVSKKSKKAKSKKAKSKKAKSKKTKSKKTKSKKTKSKKTKSRKNTKGRRKGSKISKR